MNPVLHVPRSTLRRVHGDTGIIEVPEISIYPGQVGLVVIEDDRARMTFIRFLAGLPRSTSLGWVIDETTHKSAASTVPSLSSLGLIYENSETQFSGLFNSLSSELLLPLSMAGVEEKIQELTLQHQLSVWGLTTKRDSSLSDLSDGQRQRLLVASMLLAGNELILHDGNLGYIDPIDRVRLMAYLKVLSLSTSRAVLFFAAGIDRESQEVLDLLVTADEPATENRQETAASSAHRELTPAVRSTLASSLEVDALTWRPPNSSLVLYGGLSFSLASGDAAIVTGPNGCGKSSLGYLLSGIGSPLSGAIRVQQNTEISATLFASNGVAIAPADPDYILAEEFALDEYQRTDRSLLSDKDIETLSNLLGVSEHKDKNPFSLPWHLRRNVAVLRAMAVAETAVYLDEPTADLSETAVAQFTEAVKYCASVGLIIICASNDARLIDAKVFSRIIHIPPPQSSALARSGNSSRISSDIQDPYELDQTHGVEAWEAVADDWIANTGEFCLFWSRFVYPTLAKDLFDTRILPLSAVLIDLGCGNGLHTRAVRSILSSKGCQITKTLGIDVVDKFISVAKLNSSVQTPEKFLCADLRRPEVLSDILNFAKEDASPNIVTSLFSLHDLSSLSTFESILRQLRKPGSVFFGIIVSPDFVEKSGDRESIPLVSPNIENMGNQDWSAYCSFKVSSDFENDLAVPYFHRSTQQYIDILERNWGPTSIHLQEWMQAPTKTGVDAGCRRDGIVFFRSVSAATDLD